MRRQKGLMRLLVSLLKQGNQIVKAFKDGTIEVLVQLTDHSNDFPLALD